MTAILTITLNPALDVATSVDAVRPGPKLRCAAPRFDAGGGGVNVSRAIRILGGDSLALVALGGPTGASLGMLLEAAGIATERFDAPGDTRQSLAVTDRSTGGQFRFVLPGPVWDAQDCERVLDRIAALAAHGPLAVLSGSLPPGLPDDLPARIAARLEGSGARLLVDTSGAPLQALMAKPAGIDILRLDGAEAEAVAGRPLAALADTAALARDLVGRGIARTVILARGAEGNVLVGPDGVWCASAPPQKVASAVGAGDSFVAGLVLALARGESEPEALRHGSAAASAAVITEATELCRGEDAARILRETVLREV